MRRISFRQIIAANPKTILFGSLAGICMSIVLLFVTLLAYVGITSFENTTVVGMLPPAAEQSLIDKKVGDYRKDLKTFVKQSKSKDDAVRYGAVLNLCLLHQQLISDRRYSANQQLQGFRAVAADRLKKCKKQIELQLKRDARASKKLNDDKSRSEGSDLPQEPSELRFSQYEKFIASDMQTITSLSGGPVNLWKYTGNPAGPLCDYGPDLVNLIQNTIDPEFWRRNGGNGIIEYYQPLRIIVVVGSSQIHDEISDLLNTFRANGR